jgi:hypothetical protein
MINPFPKASVNNPFKYTKDNGDDTNNNGYEYVTVNGVREKLIPGMKLVNRYGIIVIIQDGETVYIKALSGRFYKKKLQSVIRQHLNGYYYLVYSSKNMGLRRDTCLFPYHSDMDLFFSSPPKNRSDYALVMITFGIITMLADAHQYKQITEEESRKRLPTYEELYM